MLKLTSIMQGTVCYSPQATIDKIVFVMPVPVHRQLDTGYACNMEICQGRCGIHESTTDKNKPFYASDIHQVTDTWIVKII